ncbi:MAG: adenylate/guanylate cyclase domain-containing protein, partial [Pseudomonadota bacterium]
MIGSKRLSITQGIFVVTLAVAVAIAGAIILYTRHQSREQAFVVANELMNRSIETLRLKTAALIAPIDMVIQVSDEWSDVGTLPTTSGHPSRDHLIAVMTDLPQLLSLYMGYEDGDYFQIKALGQLDEEQRARYDAPPATAFVENVILRSGRSRPQALSRFLDQHGDTLGTTEMDNPDFDPRERPWYVGALDTGNVVRTGVYLFALDKVQGITVSHRHDSGVVGADMTLGALAQFLNAAPEAKDGLLAIFEASGQVLAKSSPPDTLDAAQAGARDEILKTLLDRAIADPSFESGLVKVGGDLWIVRVASISLGADTPANLLVAMPVAQVVAPIDAVSRDTLLVSLLILLASVPLIWLISRRASKPLMRLVTEADEIRHFELSDTPLAGSVVDEIQLLQRAMARMRGSLRTFSLYVPKALVKQLVERDTTPELGGRRRDVTVLFTDLENFTAMSTHLEPEEVMKRMSRYFETVTQTLHEHDATIDKYIGDAVMAFWNAPNEVPDHPARACDAALEIIETARAETDSWSQPGLPPLRTRIGIHCGDAIVGNVGSSDRMNYTAL